VDIEKKKEKGATEEKVSSYFSYQLPTEREKEGGRQIIILRATNKRGQEKRREGKTHPFTKIDYRGKEKKGGKKKGGGNVIPLFRKKKEVSETREKRGRGNIRSIRIPMGKKGKKGKVPDTTPVLQNWTRN